MMKSKLVWEGGGERTFVLVLETGEEAFAAISRFAKDQGLRAASFTAIGAFERAEVGWFDFAQKTYRPIPLDEQCEVLSLIGDIVSGEDGDPSVHGHIVLGLSDGAARGGHLLKGLVHPTLEITLVEMPAHLHRKARPDLGIALIDLS
jgi:uncharacterized protein